ncbi:discoidin domain-containing protein [Blastococcus sp. LR1]|uniref:discoidin domain-containing protein n=1 Tax=Blastococcus sp. LR1 TaxID=2877000 RepID=UPI001CCCD521|nr:discoidin domain-containing protein [Blastococcus sp. LR1]MCA0144898.1 discoidin domain-containing protein [Blastococcus sp. LR1]
MTDDQNRRGATPAPWAAAAAAPKQPAPPTHPAVPAPLPPTPVSSHWAAEPALQPDRWEDMYDEEPEKRRGAGFWALGLAAALAVAAGGYVVVSEVSAEPAASSSTGNDSSGFGAAPAKKTEAAEESAEAGASPTRSADETLSSSSFGPQGPLEVQKPMSVTATCQAPSGVDAAGAPITYEPALTLDGNPSTGWRCPGSAVGAQLTYTFSSPVTFTSVALVPGYAKVDPTDGTQRFAENRTVTAVEWTFVSEDSHVQRIASPQPSLISSKLPEQFLTTEVVLRILQTGNDGAVRDFTAISDVQFTGYVTKTE